MEARKVEPIALRTLPTRASTLAATRSKPLAAGLCLAVATVSACARDSKPDPVPSPTPTQASQTNPPAASESPASSASQPTPQASSTPNTSPSIASERPTKPNLHETVRDIETRFEAGGELADTPIRGRRYVDVGYVVKTDGTVERQLIVVEYIKSSNFHRKVHFPNRLCALFVNPERPSEAQDVQAAIELLERGQVPSQSLGYRWALSYEIETSDHCRPLDPTQVPDGFARWELRSLSDGVALRATQWRDDANATLHFFSKSEVER